MHRDIPGLFTGLPQRRHSRMFRRIRCAAGHQGIPRFRIRAPNDISESTHIGIARGQRPVRSIALEIPLVREQSCDSFGWGVKRSRVAGLVTSIPEHEDLVTSIVRSRGAGWSNPVTGSEHNAPVDVKKLRAVAANSKLGKSNNLQQRCASGLILAHLLPL
jgi:hypothetical protein